MVEMTAVKSSGNVFADLGFNAEEAANLKLRSQLMIEVDKALIEQKLTQHAYSGDLDTLFQANATPYSSRSRHPQGGV